MLLLIENNCDGFWAWPWPLLLTFLLGALLGWLLSKLFSNNSCENCVSLQAELDACRANAKLKSTKKTVVVAKVDDSVKDDLTKIEGIGPKIAELLNNDGIWSWKQLSETTASNIQRVLDAAGPKYRVHDPETWSKQAGMASRAEWEKLEKWQDEHKGGKV
ncbi:MAG: hypothetical protein L3J23_01075 [Flavobacteriaceae bacterium]|nr:hypothetical protein [Flavobacteriaceae bacterium]